ncbi:Enamine deaminase RidA, house cleaning of reactive enamine intermediates, YjgF/YER057c/UK114 family [Bosea sp. OK403]|nr:Enamine deaminase RidA, house cleaning of reactive enamine intermediates, YjgF/YER057c/UK114 family [Bosea sp. OK403]
MAQSEVVFPAKRQDLYEKYGYSAAVRSGDLLFVSGQVGSRPDGSPEPDFEAQVRLAFANLEATLAAGGCTFDDIVDLTTFHTDPEKQFGVYRTVKREKFPKAPYPNATAVGVNWLAGFDFEIKVTARIPSRTSASVSRRNPPAMWDMASRGWSHISIAEPGRIAFLSGQVAVTPGTEDVPKDLAGQAKLATANLAAALKDLEASAQDIVMLRVYVVDATSEAFGQAVAPLRELIGDAKPSITTIGVQALYKPEIKVEIEMAVRLP